MNELRSGFLNRAKSKRVFSFFGQISWGDDGIKGYDFVPARGVVPEKLGWLSYVLFASRVSWFCWAGEKRDSGGVTCTDGRSDTRSAQIYSEYVRSISVLGVIGFG